MTISIDVSTTLERDNMLQSAPLVPRLSLGPTAMDHTRMQRVRGLDRVLRGQLYDRLDREMTK